MEMLGAGLTFWPRTFVFLILIVRLNSLHASEKTVDKILQPSLCVRSKCSVVSKQHLADQNFSHLGLCEEAGEVEQAAIAPGVYVGTLFISLKAYPSSSENRMPKSVGARTQPCFTPPLLIWKGSEEDPSN